MFELKHLVPTLDRTYHWQDIHRRPSYLMLQWIRPWFSRLGGDWYDGRMAGQQLRARLRQALRPRKLKRGWRDGRRLSRGWWTWRRLFIDTAEGIGTAIFLWEGRSTDVWLEFIETAVFAEGASDCGCGLDEGERESDKGTDVEVDAFKYGFDFTNLSEVEAGHSAACEMSLLCFRFWVHIGGFQVDEPEIWEQRDKFPFRIITAEVAELLHIPLDFGTRQSLSALWALAYTRSSSRPVDTVFSLMDLLGINLDVEQFLPEERTKATIKLIQEVMKLQGGRALWLYIAPWVKPSWEISTLPEMPETSESGRAYFSTSTGKVLAIDAICAEERWRAGGLPNPTPKGEMTDSGYFVFSAKAALVSLVQA
ncbi:hypothetical protein ARMSODRAFT_1026198 [Armillaria solidipes]|uniref:Uncharacterized protein n=1 Tax=Armillaria solidipes TaxID=1076256 RepID=A0A2H3B429_9AGAR|nr:hypothetical protein ARMSODRAFT_1026198 [Armillaria solidipes]